MIDRQETAGNQLGRLRERAAPEATAAVDELNNNYGEMAGDKEVTEMKIRNTGGRNREFCYRLISPVTAVIAVLQLAADTSFEDRGWGWRPDSRRL
jgi:hypothetical protein